jgi:4-hydroxybenzoate polyprenyltransferase
VTTVRISIPDDVKAFIDGRMARRDYATVSEYLCALIREAQEKCAKHALEAKLVEGLQSPASELIRGLEYVASARPHEKTQASVRRMTMRGIGGVREYLDLVKFSHTLFALPFALLGAVLSARGPDGWRGRVQDWVGILLCMATARSAAMAFNRLADRHYDALNPRTASRHLPARRLTTREVAVFTLGSGLAFAASTLLFLPNRWPLYLSAPVLLWLLGYSYSKRFTSLSHFWLGASLSLAPLAAWIALRGDVQWPPVLLALAVLLWVAGFDMIYACQDAEFDRAAGLRSIPRALGVRRALWLAAACHALMIVPLVGLGLVYPLGRVYFLGVAAVAALLVYEHALVRPDDLSRVNVAFFNVNVVISLGLLVASLVDLML